MRLRLMVFFTVSSLRALGWRAWNSDGMAAVRFYGRYLRGPLLLGLLALAADKLLFYGALPLGSYVERE